MIWHELHLTSLSHGHFANSLVWENNKKLWAVKQQALMIMLSWNHKYNYFFPSVNLRTTHSTPDHTSAVYNNYLKVAVT